MAINAVCLFACMCIVLQVCFGGCCRIQELDWAGAGILSGKKEGAGK